MLIGTRRAQSDRPVAVNRRKLDVQRRQGALRRRTGAICGNLKDGRTLDTLESLFR